MENQNSLAQPPSQPELNSPNAPVAMPVSSDDSEMTELGAAVDELRDDTHQTDDILDSVPAEEEKPIAVSANKLRVLVRALKSCEQNINNIVRMLEGEMLGQPSEHSVSLESLANSVELNREMELAGVRPVDGRIVEGIFDGQNMVGSDGKIYSIPPNYASKSKLVEGDMLKLTISSSGSFIYKQIGPIDRVRIIASLGFDATIGEYYATFENRRWNILKASVTYYKGEPGDEIVLLVPKNEPSKWAAVENVIKRNPIV